MHHQFMILFTEKEVTEGEMFIDVKYNGKDLYNNHWDLCHVEDDREEEDRIIFCPIKPGRQLYVKQLKIPIYIPKVSRGPLWFSGMSLWLAVMRYLVQIPLLV